MFDTNNTTVQTEKAAKIEAKSRERIAKQQRILEMKKNQIGVYKKIGPFTIKTYLIIIAIIVIGIMMLVEKSKENSSGNQKPEGVNQESVNNQ